MGGVPSPSQAEGVCLLWPSASRHHAGLQARLDLPQNSTPSPESNQGSFSFQTQEISSSCPHRDHLLQKQSSLSLTGTQAP
jgi:hypothetical protein